MTAPIQDTAASVEFLKLFRPAGPWVLTAIAPDKKDMRTKTFTPDREAELRTWLEGVVGRLNVYFEVNPPLRELSKKAERTDIARVEYLHVDIDPRAGEDLAAERTRILERLTTKRPDGIPVPTIVVFSGGGYQGFWKLSDPIPVDGQLEKAEAAKLYNLQLERVFGGDHCHNVDRIMRLPGTINLPDAKKIKKGRTPTRAELVRWHTDAVYPLSAFKPAEIVQAVTEEGLLSGLPGDALEISGNIAKLSNVDDLDTLASPPLPSWVKVVIVQGRDPENPTKYESRSNALWAVVCALVRSHVPDEMIFSVITDPDFRISDSVLDKGSNIRRYALKQIRDAKEHAISPWLLKLNQEFAVIGSMAGACRVVEEVYDPILNRTLLEHQSFQDFRNRWLNVRVETGKDAKGNPTTKDLGDWWLRHPDRRSYQGMIFAPGQDRKGYYNLWKGFAYEPKPGDCSLLLAHIRENLCGDVEEYYQYILGWMAQAVQRPDEQGHTAIVLRGKEGTGKSCFADALGSLFGRHYLPVSDPEDIVGRFNGHLMDCVVLFGDEAFFAGDKKHEGILKALITQDTLRAQYKFLDTKTVRNHTHLILASNATWIIPAGSDARRYFMLDVSKAHMQDRPYFKAIYHQLDNGGREALLHFLQTYDLSTFDVRNVPKTEALKEQKMLSRNPEQDWWAKKLEDGSLTVSRDRWTGSVRIAELVDDYVTHMQRFTSQRRGTETGLGIFLRKVCPEGWPQRKRISEGGRRVWAYLFPSLATCRAEWDKNFGGPFDWPKDVEDIEEEETTF